MCSLGCAQVRADIVLTDLTAALSGRLRGAVDVCVFNPPYVPSESSELEGDGLSRAWAGGCDGREVLDRLIPSLDALLSARAVMYLVVLANANKPAELLQRMRDTAKLTAATVLAERKVGVEHLQIYRLTR